MNMKSSLITDPDVDAAYVYVGEPSLKSMERLKETFLNHGLSDSESVAIASELVEEGWRPRTIDITVESTQEFHGDVNVDFDVDGNVVGIEFIGEL